MQSKLNVMQDDNIKAKEKQQKNVSDNIYLDDKHNDQNGDMWRDD
jgi:hypothetical protein